MTDVMAEGSEERVVDPEETTKEHRAYNPVNHGDGSRKDKGEEGEGEEDVAEELKHVFVHETEFFDSSSELFHEFVLSFLLGESFAANKDDNWLCQLLLLS